MTHCKYIAFEDYRNHSLSKFDDCVTSHIVEQRKQTPS